MINEVDQGNHNYSKLRKDNLKKWRVFINERFHPLSHFLMIILFFMAHYYVADASKYVVVNNIDLLWATIGTTIFFLKLRYYDEIKDYELDVVINPNRPLPRGLINHYDLKNGIEKCIILEIVFFASAGNAGLIGILIAIAYSLLMYKEFFIGKYIRPHLTTYATSHTVVTFFLSMAIFSAISGKLFWKTDNDFYYFSAMSWLLFNIFELGRKIYQPIEERNKVESYSKVWTRPGAFLLVFIHAIIAALLLLHITTVDFFLMQYIQIASLTLLLVVGLLYLFIKKTITGIIFRAFSSAYIVIIYGALIFNYIIRKYY